MHNCLGHISRKRMERLIKEEILSDLDFSYIDTCVDCINGKLTTKIRNAKADMNGPFTPPNMGGTNISSCSLMIIPVVVLSSSFVRSLTLRRLLKEKVDFPTREEDQSGSL